MTFTLRWADLESLGCRLGVWYRFSATGPRADGTWWLEVGPLGQFRETPRRSAMHAAYNARRRRRTM